MKIVKLKTDPINFAETDAGAKTSEIRYNDHGFRVGDCVMLCETVHSGKDMAESAILYPLEYTEYYILARITHIHSDQGMKDGWVVLSYVILDKVTQRRELGVDAHVV